MKRILMYVTVFSLFLVTAGADPVSAKIIQSDKGSVVIGKSEVVNDDLFIGAQAVTIEGVVNGDVFVGTQILKITGTINGNVHAGAQTVDLSGQVKGNVYIGGQTIQVSGGKISGSLFTGAQSVTVDKTSAIGGSFFAGASSVRIDMSVGRSVYTGASSLYLGENTKIGKDFYYATGKNSTSIDKKAIVAGSVHKSEFDQEQKTEFVKVNAVSTARSFKFFGTLISFLGALIVGFILVRFYPKFLNGASGIVAKSFWKSFGVGFLITIAFIPGLFVLVGTVVGAPLAGIAVLFMILFSYLSKFVVTPVLGKVLAERLNRKLSPFATLMIGLAAFYLLMMIPFFGFFVGITVFWSGLGALTLLLLSHSK